MFLISRGSYSDYRVVVAVDGDEATAEAVAARMNALDSQGFDHYEVEEVHTVSGPDDVQLVVVHQVSTSGPDDNIDTFSQAFWAWDVPADEADGCVVSTRPHGYISARSTDPDRARKALWDQRARNAALATEPGADAEVTA